MEMAHEESIPKVKSRKNQKGVALLVALFTITILTFLAVELSYDTSVEYVVSNNEYRRMKAYYAAKSGLELSLLRILLYRKVVAQFGENLKGQEELINKIWSFPFVWPIVPPDDINSVEKDQIKEAVGEALMDSSYFTTISSEGSKLDLNDLASPSESLQKTTKDQLTKLLQDRADEDDEFGDFLRNYDYESLINNIKDWVDEDSVSDNGGDEGAAYSNIDTDSEVKLPPNREFRTLEEVRMVSGMDDRIYNFLLPRITVYGVKGINPNYADKALLKSINEDITDEVADEIIAHRNDPQKGPFSNKEAFFSFLESERVDTGAIEDSKIPLYFDTEYNFRIESVGTSGSVIKKIVAIVYDVDATAARLKELLPKDEKDGEDDGNGNGNGGGNGGGNGATTTTTTTNTTSTTKPPPPKGRPNVIYYYED
ncbi:MAG: general secretion pathway protein GspK, partial [Bdellovibrionales bacterium]|nr:general secretion pathway protein GspK [Bdellovibrionales bacterium]